MDAVTSSNAPVAAQIYAMKKSQDVDERAVMDVLNSASVQNNNLKDAKLQDSVAQKTGLGQSLDLLA
ncbi:hypothetical protein [Sulfurimonas sp. HSL-1716]|uniref:hypothetical protein n=1 Tax=Hydrocurvibacter sulfurireducens TaxID=3131937 RepID=UPI0031F75BC0